MSPRRLLAALTVFGSSLPLARATNEAVNPLAKVTQMLEDLKGKIEKDSEKQAATYTAFRNWCRGSAQDENLRLEASRDEKDKLEASISKLSSDVESASMKVDELAASVSAASERLKKAVEIRKKEAADFDMGEKELVETTDVLERAIKVFDQQAQKGSSAALMQIENENTASVVQSLTAVVDAASFSTADRERLVALAQRSSDEADDAALGAPSAASYKSHSAGLIDVLEDLKEKSEQELADLRKAETRARHEHELLKQSLEEEIEADSKDLETEKSNKAAATEKQAGDEGDLKRVVEELAETETLHKKTTDTCMQTAADHEASVKAREEEVKVVEGAMEALGKSGAGANRTYSFVQVSTSSALARSGTAAEAVKRLAREHHSAALAQLAAQIAATVRYGTRGTSDPFRKIRYLIQNMIQKLHQQMDSEAEEKAYCDDEMQTTAGKKEELTDESTQLKTKTDQAVAKAAELREQTKDLESEMAALSEKQAEMYKIRQEEHEEFLAAKADLEAALSGVRKGLDLLRKYYANKDEGASLIQDDSSFNNFMQQPAAPANHKKSSGAGSAIIALLEVVDSDFAKDLAKQEMEESDAQTSYETLKQEDAVSGAKMEREVKYKVKEAKTLDKEISELASTKDNTDAELSAVNEYYTKLKDRCVAKPSTYEERKKRRVAEVTGLQETLRTLEGEEALVQRSNGRNARHFRGSLTPGS